ncbi:MAG: ergothioneine biosynthesis protein EgtB [Longimicrobiales bacterium]|nr:ergothioneine biosynthesis protein EgtB [Longimicrobiales bacterium]
MTHADWIERLQEARARTLLLIAPLDAEDLRCQHDPLMSPIVWDLGHIAHFEEIWLLENIEGEGGGGEGLRGIYDPFRNPRATRDQLALPDLAETHAYLGAVRRAVLQRLRTLDLDRADQPLLRDGFVFRLVLQHEYQHNETILQTLQLKRGAPYPAPRALAPPTTTGGMSGPEMVRIPAGRVEVGTDDRSAAYDNERPLHGRDLATFEIDRTPVTNADFVEFIDAGGYANPAFWTPEGFEWIHSKGITHPMYWSRVDGGWEVRRMDRVGPLPPDHPVCHVCYWEADAYARWAGKRLPTEFEWEAAARWDPATGHLARFPWGDDPATPDRANLDQLLFDTTPVDAWSENVSPTGVYGMIGDVWEWTASDFHGYPGYETFPYPEYSEVFFGEEYKVLRGGSWATRTGAIRTTFRNWDYPIRRQIFAGFRCARDV